MEPLVLENDSPVMIDHELLSCQFNTVNIGLHFDFLTSGN